MRHSPPLLRRTKLFPPTPPRGYIRVRSPWPATPPPVLLVCAPAGYGKTSALASLCDDQPRPTVWYSLDGADADPAVFFAYLVAGVAAHLPGFGQATSTLIAGAQATAVQLAGAFLAELENVCLPAMRFVLDGWDALPTGGELTGALELLLAAPVPGLSWAIASRHCLFRLARFKASGRAIEVGARALAFDEEEERLFWQARIERPAPPDAVSRTAAALEGWPLGLELLAHWHLEDPTARCPAVSLDEAFIDALIGAEPPAVRDFMLKSALLESVEPSDFQRVFHTAPPEGIVPRLTEANLLSVAPGGLRFQPLLLEVLQAAAQRRFEESQRRAWHVRAGMSFSHADPELAMRHFLKAGDAERALDVAASLFPRYWATGRVGTIGACLDRLSDEQRAREPRALLWRGRLAEWAGSAREAEALYHRAALRAEEEGSQPTRFGALTRLATVYAARDDVAGFERALRDARPWAEEAPIGDQCDLLLAQALMAERLGEEGAPLAFNKRILDFPIDDDVDVAHAQGTALLNLAGYAYNQGDWAEARSYLNRLHQAIRRHGLTGLRSALWLTRGMLSLRDGDLDEVATCLGQLGGDWEATLAWQDAVLAHELAADLAMSRGEWPQAREHLAMAERGYEGAGASYGTLAVTDGHLRLAGRQGLFEEGRQRFAAITPPSLADPFGQQMELTYAQVLALSGADGEAAERLERLLPRLPPGLSYRRTQASLLLGLMRRRESLLAEGLALLAKGGFHALLAEAPALYARYAEALPDVRGGAEALAVAGRRFGPPPRPATGSVPERLSLRCFGAFEVMRGSTPLNKWPRRKIRALLALLAAYPDGLPRSELAVRLYGEELNAEHNLRALVSGLRSLLEPELPARGTSRFLVFAHDRYQLLPDSIAYCDLAEFRELRRRAQEARLEGRLRQAQDLSQRLMALYRGNLFDEPALGSFFEAETQLLRREIQEELRWLASSYMAQENGLAALAVIQRLLAIDDLSEPDVLLAVETYLRMGVVGLAQQAIHDYRQHLRRGLDEQPSPEFERRANALLQGPGPGATRGRKHGRSLPRAHGRDG